MSTLNIILAVAAVVFWAVPLGWYFRQDVCQAWRDYRQRWTT